jgi:ABC-2 type transport system permease protein
MNIFLREIKANIKSLFIWCMAMVAMIGGGMGKYAGFTGAGESINDMLDIYPKSLLNIMGISGFDLSTAIGFYGVLFLYLILLAATHAIMLGAGIIAKEERDKTTEFLFAKPISRSRVITFKLLAGLLNIIILNVVTLIGSLIVVNYFNKGDDITNDIIILMMGMFILQLIYISIGALLASIRKKSRDVAYSATGILLITFMLYMVTNINEGFEALKYFTPFKYFEAEPIILGRGINFLFIILSGVIMGISLIVTYESYRGRDLDV